MYLIHFKNNIRSKSYKNILCLIYLAFTMMACMDDSQDHSSNMMHTEVDYIDSTPNTSRTTFPEKVDDLSPELLARIDFPAAQDLAILLSNHHKAILAEDFLPTKWLDQVAESLLASELQEDIRDENWIEDWKLVSIRISPCAPLGKVAKASEIDQMCWPQIRLVWQPLVERVSIFGVIRDVYADDRAVHTLYFPSAQDEQLLAMQKHIQDGGTWEDLSTDVQARFTHARVRLAHRVLQTVSNLRLTQGSYAGVDLRAEYYLSQLEIDAWYTQIAEMITRYCLDENLSELTAFSLPLGRSPASAELWVFIAFSGENGVITPIDLDVFDPQDGSLLYQFSHSEDVTTGVGDPRLLKDLEVMSAEQQDKIIRQIIIDTDQLSSIGDRLNDPYQTLVPNTSCSSCHRANHLNFNFHNLSYFEDQEMSIAPRSVNDVKRDLQHAIQIWSLHVNDKL